MNRKIKNQSKLATTLNVLKRERKVLADSRDRLRDAYEEMDELISASDDAERALQEVIDRLSELL